jgi:carboxymethylenebutenolidase
MIESLLCGLLMCGSNASADAGSSIQPITGQIKPDQRWFNSGSSPIDEFHCEPASAGKHPIVMLIHGCAPQGFGDDEFKQMCLSLAEHGYFAMFVEYYSRTGQPNCREYTLDGNYNPGSTHTIPEDILNRELGAAGASLDKNPKADTSRFGAIGFSLGGTEAIVSGLLYPSKVKAIVDYYGFTSPRLKTLVGEANPFPPTLFLHGDADSRARVANAIELDEIIATHQRAQELHIYPGVEHGFNFHEAAGYDPRAAADAWQRALAFLDRQLKELVPGRGRDREN